MFLKRGSLRGEFNRNPVTLLQFLFTLNVTGLVLATCSGSVAPLAGVSARERGSPLSGLQWLGFATQADRKLKGEVVASGSWAGRPSKDQAIA